MSDPNLKPTTSLPPDNPLDAILKEPSIKPQLPDLEQAIPGSPPASPTGSESLNLGVVSPPSISQPLSTTPISSLTPPPGPPSFPPIPKTKSGLPPHPPHAAAGLAAATTGTGVGKLPPPPPSSPPTEPTPKPKKPFPKNALILGVLSLFLVGGLAVGVVFMNTTTEDRSKASGCANYSQGLTGCIILPEGCKETYNIHVEPANGRTTDGACVGTNSLSPRQETITGGPGGTTVCPRSYGGCDQCVQLDATDNSGGAAQYSNNCGTKEKEAKYFTCEDMTASEAPKIGSKVAFTCKAGGEAVDNVKDAQFRYKLDSGEYQHLRMAQGNLPQKTATSDPITIQTGTYNVQCRFCTNEKHAFNGMTCTPWQFTHEINLNP